MGRIFISAGHFNRDSGAPSIIGTKEADEMMNWTVRSSRKINEFTRVSAPNVLHPSSRLTIAERLSMQGF